MRNDNPTILSTLSVCGCWESQLKSSENQPSFPHGLSAADSPEITRTSSPQPEGGVGGVVRMGVQGRDVGRQGGFPTMSSQIASHLREFQNPAN